MYWNTCIGNGSYICSWFYSFPCQKENCTYTQYWVWFVAKKNTQSTVCCLSFWMFHIFSVLSWAAIIPVLITLITYNLHVILHSLLIWNHTTECVHICLNRWCCLLRNLLEFHVQNTQPIAVCTYGITLCRVLELYSGILHWCSTLEDHVHMSELHIIMQ